MRGLLEIVASAHEFDTILSRHEEDHVLRQLAERLPYKHTAASMLDHANLCKYDRNTGNMQLAQALRSMI